MGVNLILTRYARDELFVIFCLNLMLWLITILLWSMMRGLNANSGEAQSR